MEGEWVRKPTGNITVVYVHGILSDSRACWLNKNGEYWPDLLCKDVTLKKIGIYIYTYETGIFSGSYNLNNIVSDFKERIITLDKVFDCKRVVFVCHSMGGIVVRKFLVQQAVFLINSKIDIGLFLVASPSLGASYANLLRPLAKLFGNSQADVLRFADNNLWLNGLDDDFINLINSRSLKLFGKELVEDKFIILKGWFCKQVVRPFAGARYFGHPYKVPMSDHFTIAKPSNEQAIQHRLLCEFLHENDCFPFNKPKTVRLKNVWMNTYISFQDKIVSCVDIRRDSNGDLLEDQWNAKWILEEIGQPNFYRIKNKQNNKFLNIESGIIQSSDVEDDWWSSHWVFESVRDTNSYWLKNRWKNTFLNIENGNLECSEIKSDWWSGMWKIEKTK